MATMRTLKNVAKNYSPAQVKVREATSNDPWGPSISVMLVIADLSYNVVAFTEIMTLLWKRLGDHGQNWRHVYKSLVVLDYLIKTGSERVAQQCKENIFAINTLKDFQFFDRDGKDQGVNVREKSKNLVSLLKDGETLKSERTRVLKAKERFAQSLQDIGSDTKPNVTATESSSSSSPTSNGAPEIPAEIWARGLAASKLFLAARDEGYKDFNLVRLMVMGQENVGKTCLIDSIIGKEFNEKHDITDAIAITRNCRLDGSDENTLEEDDNIKEKYENTLALDVANNLKWDDQNVMSAPEHESDESPEHSDADGVREVEKKQRKLENTPQASTSVENKQHVSSDEYTKNIAGKVEIFLRGGTRRLDTDDTSIRIWDYGGQPIYHSIHRLFVTPEGICIIVFKLTDDLKSFTVIKDSNGVKHTYHMTNLQHLLYWIRSAYTYSPKSNRDEVLGLDLPACIIVGTHYNSLAETDPERRRLAKEKFDEIRKAIANTPYESHVYPKYFEVENQLSSADENVGKLKEVILKIKKRMSKPIPLKWIDFLIKIQELGGEKLTLPLEEVKSKAMECGITDDETIDLAIGFFSDVGEIMHHPSEEALHDTVVLQPMKLVDYVKTVFTVIKPELQDAIRMKEWRELEKGILRKSLLKHLWSKLPAFSDDKDEKMFTFFVTLMKKFGLICQQKTQAGKVSDNSVFYAFSHIQPDREAKETDDKGNDKIVIFHDFLGFLPDYVFQHVVTRFIEEFQLENASHPELAYECVELDIDDYHRTRLEVATIKHRRMFKTTILRRQMADATDVTEPDPKTCKQVLEFLHSVFDALCKTSKRAIEYKTCIPCGCSNNYQHMQIINNFNRDVMPCGQDLRSMKRYCHLFGDSSEAIAYCPLEDMVLLDICNALDKDWRSLAICLGITKAELDVIEMDNINQKDVMMATLVKWRNRQPSDINQMNAMDIALKQAGYHHIADRMKGKTTHSGVLHDNDLLSVGEGIGINWQCFGVHLGFSWVECDRLKSQHPDSITNARMEMLTTWKKRQSHEINQVDVMCRLLEKRGFLAVANQLRGEEQPEGFLTEEDFDLITDDICGDWQRLARKLRITWKTIQEFREDCSGCVYSASMKVLTTWKTGLSNDINQVDTMCKALNDIGRTDIAEQLTKNHAP